MTRLNLAQTCLLDISGELGQKAKVQLHEHVAKYPAAMLEYELVRSQFDLLRSVPRLPLDQTASLRVAEAIKQGIADELVRRQRQIVIQRRWRVAYRALAGISAVAAAVVVFASVHMVQRESERRQVSMAASHMMDYLSTDTTNQTDADLAHVATQLSDLEDAQIMLASPEAPSSQFVQDLINSADDLPDMPDTPDSL